MKLTRLLAATILITLLGFGCKKQPTTTSFEHTTVPHTATTTPITLATAPSSTTALSETTAATTTYSGTRLAGSSAPLLEFNEQDYDRALTENKLIVLYFYADWCPTCNDEYPELVDAFNQLSTDHVVGFRLHFNDSKTTEAERILAQEFGVAYQHTKIFVKDGVRYLKSPESWDQQRYLLEIATAL